MRRWWLYVATLFSVVLPIVALAPRGAAARDTTPPGGAASSPLALPDDWQSSGPYGGTIISIAVSSTNDDLVAAGTQKGGVFTTTDGGANWSVHGPPDGIDVYGLTFAPGSATELYAVGEQARAGRKVHPGPLCLREGSE